MKKVTKTPISRLTLIKVLVISAIFIFILGGWFIWLIANDQPPEDFPLNNPQGEYKITKECPGGQGAIEKFQHYQGQNYIYCVEYKGSGVFMDSEQTNFFRITVGNSQVDLQPFLNKKVKNIQGKYTGSSKQCIQDTCVDIGGPYTVLNIDSLEAVEEQ